METQDTVGSWIDTTFPGTDPESPRKALRALEEMVELCLASGAMPNQIYDTIGTLLPAWNTKPATRAVLQPDQIPVEAADVLIVLYGVAHMRGFNLHTEVDKKMLKNRKRHWKALGDGTGYHIKTV